MFPTLIVAAIAGLAILLVAVGLASSAGGSGVNTRLERYASGRRDDRPEPSGDSAGALAGLSQTAAIAAVSRAVESRDFGVTLTRDIARADLKLKVSEYLVLWVLSTLGVPVAFVALSTVLPTLGSPLFLIVGLLVGFWLPRAWLRRRQATRLAAFNRQLPDTITLIANALRAGASFLQSIELVVRETQPPISSEFARVIREVNLGLSFDESLENMVRRVRSDDLELMATAIAIQHQVGGNLAEILDSIAFTIRERVRIKGEIRTLTAQQRLSGYVVGFLPIGLALLLSVISPGYMEPMFQNPPGIAGLPAGLIILFIGGLSMFFGFMAIRRIVDIEV